MPALTLDLTAHKWHRDEAEVAEQRPPRSHHDRFRRLRADEPEQLWHAEGDSVRYGDVGAWGWAVPSVLRSISSAGTSPEVPAPPTPESDHMQALGYWS